MMSNPSNRKILSAKHKYSVTDMDVDDDNRAQMVSHSVQGTGMQGGAVTSGSGLMIQNQFLAPNMTPPATPTNRFPLPAAAQLQGHMQGATPVTTAGPFLSQSEGAMFSQPKRLRASHYSLQTTPSMQYISVPDTSGIHRNVPVNDMQLQQVFAILSGQAQVPAMGLQQLSLGSLPSSGISTQSLFSTPSMQASTGNVSLGSADLTSFLSIHLQNPHSHDEIIRARQLLDQQLFLLQGGVSQEQENAETTNDLKLKLLVREDSKYEHPSEHNSCEHRYHSETSSAENLSGNNVEKPKSGVINKLLSRLFKAKL